MSEEVRVSGGTLLPIPSGMGRENSRSSQPNPQSTCSRKTLLLVGSLAVFALSVTVLAVVLSLKVLELSNQQGAAHLNGDLSAESPRSGSEGDSARDVREQLHQQEVAAERAAAYETVLKAEQQKKVAERAAEEKKRMDAEAAERERQRRNAAEEAARRKALAEEDARKQKEAKRAAPTPKWAFEDATEVRVGLPEAPADGVGGNVGSSAGLSVYYYVGGSLTNDMAGFNVRFRLDAPTAVERYDLWVRNPETSSFGDFFKESPCVIWYEHERKIAWYQFPMMKETRQLFAAADSVNLREVTFGADASVFALWERGHSVSYKVRAEVSREVLFEISRADEEKVFNVDDAVRAVCAGKARLLDQRIEEVKLRIGYLNQRIAAEQAMPKRMASEKSDYDLQWARVQELRDRSASLRGGERETALRELDVATSKLNKLARMARDVDERKLRLEQERKLRLDRMNLELQQQHERVEELHCKRSAAMQGRKELVNQLKRGLYRVSLKLK